MNPLTAFPTPLPSSSPPQGTGCGNGAFLPLFSVAASYPTPIVTLFVVRLELPPGVKSGSLPYRP